MSETIFTIATPEDGDTKKTPVDPRGLDTAKAMGLAYELHKTKHTESSEPDWQGLLLNAKNSTEKWKIRAARDEWNAEQKIKAHQQAQAAMDARITEALSAPVARNKAYYDRLQQQDGRVYWSVPVQRQMKTDKAQLGLAWYSKK